MVQPIDYTKMFNGCTSLQYNNMVDFSTTTEKIDEIITMINGEIDDKATNIDNKFNTKTNMFNTGITTEKIDDKTITMTNGKLDSFRGLPAVTHDNGDKEWYKDGQLHRLDGPAIERVNGYKAWYVYGELHNIKGPAIIHENGDKEFYIDGIKYEEEIFYNNITLKNIRLKKHTNENNYKNKFLITLNGRLHNKINEPAYTYNTGSADRITKEYVVNGIQHRTNGPAVYNKVNSRWLQYGRRHNENGYAVTYMNTEQYYLNDKLYAKREYIDEIENKTSLEELTIDGNKVTYRFGVLHTEDNIPTIIKQNGDKYYYKLGILHRENGPAIQLSNGDKHYYQLGFLHNEDGPAIQLSNGDNKWYKYGVELTEDEFKSEFNDKLLFKKTIEFDGDIRTTKNGKLHSYNDEPALIKGNKKEWYKDGLLHRIIGPAIIIDDNITAWYKDGQLHSDNGPAITIGKKYHEFFLYGKKYTYNYYSKVRTVSNTFADMIQYFTISGLYSKITDKNEDMSVELIKIILGDNITYDSYVYDTNKSEIFCVEDLQYFIDKNLENIVKNGDGINSIKYYENGIIYDVQFIKSINKVVIRFSIYYKGRTLTHRENGPAILLYEIDDNNINHLTNYYYCLNKIHNGNGYAVEHNDGSKHYYLDDKPYSAFTYKLKTLKRINRDPYRSTIIEIKLDFKEEYNKGLERYKNRSNEERLSELSDKVKDISEESNYIDKEKRESVLNKTKNKLKVLKTLCDNIDYYLLQSIYEQTYVIYELFKNDETLEVKFLEQLEMYYTDNLIELLNKIVTNINNKDKNINNKIKRKELHISFCKDAISKVNNKNEINSFLYNLENQIASFYNQYKGVEDYRLIDGDKFIFTDYYVDPKNFYINKSHVLHSVPNDDIKINNWNIEKSLLTKLVRNKFIFNYEYSFINKDLNVSEIITVCSLNDGTKFRISKFYGMYISEYTDEIDSDLSTYVTNIEKDLAETEIELKSLDYQRSNIKNEFFSKKLENTLKDYLDKLDEFNIKVTENDLSTDTKLLDTVINTEMLNI